MATVQVNEKNFEATVAKGIVVLDFWAAWCGPCRMFAPIFEAASKRHPDVVFGKIDTDAEPGLASAFDIRAIPTLAVLRDGVLLAVQSGVVPAAGLDQIIAKVKAVDMVELKRKIAGLKAPAARAANG